MKVSSLNVSTDRSLLFSNFGSLSVTAVDEGGSNISRTATYGSFGVTHAVNCIPCSKGTVFEAVRNVNSSWLTEGTAQGPPPTEWATFEGQIVSPTSWSVSIQPPRRSPLVKWVPVRLVGSLVIRRNTGTATTTYTDSDVDLTGYMRVEFIRDNSARLFSWRAVQITATSTQ